MEAVITGMDVASVPRRYIVHWTYMETMLTVSVSASCPAAAISSALRRLEADPYLLGLACSMDGPDVWDVDHTSRARSYHGLLVSLWYDNQKPVYIGYYRY